MATVAAMLSCESIWVVPRSDTPRGTRPVPGSGSGSIKYRGGPGGQGEGPGDPRAPLDMAAQAQLAHAKLRSSFGDHITYLNIYQKCWNSNDNDNNYNKNGNNNDKNVKEWCEMNFIRCLFLIFMYIHVSFIIFIFILF